MKNQITFKIEGLPKSPNSLLGAHWKVRSSHAKQWKRLVYYYTIGLRPMKPWGRVELHLTRFSSSKMDRDGVYGSFKPVVDGLKEAGIIVDDNDDVIKKWVVKWDKGKPGKGYIEITVINLES